MKVNFYRDDSITENRADIYYYEENSELESIRNFFNSYNIILGKKEDLQQRIYPDEIYYLEIVDRRCFAYLQNEVFQIDFSLKNFIDIFHKYGFIQIGKSLIVNIYKIKIIKTDLNMRLRLCMENEETLILNRTYKKDFLTFINMMQEAANENH